MEDDQEVFQEIKFEEWVMEELEEMGINVESLNNIKNITDNRHSTNR